MGPHLESRSRIPAGTPSMARIWVKSRSTIAWSWPVEAGRKVALVWQILLKSKLNAVSHRTHPSGSPHPHSHQWPVFPPLNQVFPPPPTHPGGEYLALVIDRHGRDAACVRFEDLFEHELRTVGVLGLASVQLLVDVFLLEDEHAHDAVREARQHRHALRVNLRASDRDTIQSIYCIKINVFLVVLLTWVVTDIYTIICLKSVCLSVGRRSQTAGRNSCSIASGDVSNWSYPTEVLPLTSSRLSSA